MFYVQLQYVYTWCVKMISEEEKEKKKKEASNMRRI